MSNDEHSNRDEGEREARLARAGLRDSRRRLWMAAGIGVALGAAVLIPVRLSHRSETSPPVDASRRPAAPPTGVFATGGVPALVPPPLLHAFQETLADWVIALNQTAAAGPAGSAGRDSEHTQALPLARATLLSPEVVSLLGAGPTGQLERVLLRAASTASAPTGEPAQQAAEQLFDAVGSFNDALAAAGHGLFLDADVLDDSGGRRVVLLFAFTVSHVRVFSADGRSIRALQVRRLDRLNFTHRVLGFTSPHVRDAIVLLDQVDELLVNYVLPALVPDAEVELIDDDSLDESQPWQAEVQRRGGEAIRREYARAAGVEAAAAVRLGQLLSARRRLFAGWDGELARRGAGLRQPRTLRLVNPAGLRDSLANSVPEAELAELMRIEAELAQPNDEQLFSAARDVIIASVERHEVQHRIDAALASPRPLPAILEQYTGPLVDSEGKPRPGVALARDELSAYLAELARDPITPAVNLTLTSRFLFDRTRWGTPECYAALAIVAALANELGLAAELGVDRPGAMVARGAVVRPLVARVYLALSARPIEQLREAARRAWERLFETPLPAVEILHNRAP